MIGSKNVISYHIIRPNHVILPQVDAKSVAQPVCLFAVIVVILWAELEFAINNIDDYLLQQRGLHNPRRGE